MDHETAERVARAIYGEIRQEGRQHVYATRFDDGTSVAIGGPVDLIKCAKAAIAAYMEGAVEIHAMKPNPPAEAFAQLTRERDAAVKENIDMNMRIRDMAARLRNYEMAGKALKHFLREAQ